MPYTCTLCAHVRTQGSMPIQYLCTWCNLRIKALGLHGGRQHWRDALHKGKWDPVVPGEMAQIVISSCSCNWADFPKGFEGHYGRPDGDDGCRRCWGTGTIIRRKSPIELLAEQAD